MEDEDKCMSYGHVPKFTRDYSEEYDAVTHTITRSKRRKKMYICTRCGARDI